jgi:hypothetical protein
MASESVANLFDLLKEVWTQDRLEKQFYDGTRFLDRVEKTNKYTIGRQAQVPVETALPGGTSTKLAAGGALNASDALHVDRADYILSYIWQQVSLETGALNQGVGPGVHSTVDAADQTITSNVLALRKDAMRQVVSNGDALIAATTGSATSTEVELSPTGYGYDAIVRGWLRPGITVDIGTAADDDSAAADRVITAVEEVAATPSITVSGAAVVLTANEFVSIANNRVNNTAVNETSGLRTIVGSATSTIGTIAPASVPSWKPAQVDTTTTTVSLDLLLNLQRNVYQKTGKWPTYVTTSPKQAADLYALYQNQVRFEGDTGGAAGNVDGFKWNGMSINADPDIPDRELYLLTIEDFLVVTGGKFGKPTWASEIEGSGGRFRWTAGNTTFTDAVVYPLQLAVKQRNSHAAAIALTG